MIVWPKWKHSFARSPHDACERVRALRRISDLDRWRYGRRAKGSAKLCFHLPTIGKTMLPVSSLPNNSPTGSLQLTAPMWQKYGSDSAKLSVKAHVLLLFMI